MIVHFDCASPVAVANPDYYKGMIRVIENFGHKVANIWDKALYIEMAQSVPDEEDLEMLCKKTLMAIDRSDAVILDVLGEGVFGLGYQAAYALYANKPLLLLQHDGEETGSFVGGLKHPRLQRSSVGNNVEDVISMFLRKASER